jgi:chromosome segregation ATPase
MPLCLTPQELEGLRQQAQIRCESHNNQGNKLKAYIEVLAVLTPAHALPLCLQELEDLRQQARIWCDSHHSEGDKLKVEVELLNGQLLQRSNELSSIREQLTEARAERDRALQERQQVRASCSGIGVTVAASCTRLAGQHPCQLIWRWSQFVHMLQLQ